MLYVDILNSNHRKLNKIINLLKYFLKILTPIKIEEKNVIYLPIRENEKKSKLLKIFKKLDKYIKKNNFKNIVLSENLNNNELLKETLGNINILDGTWIYNYILEDSIEYIFRIQKTKFEREEISILVNEINDINIENIKLISRRCKVLNIVTNDPKKIECIEKYLNDNYGIIVNVTKNKNKSLLKSNIIINIDYSEELLNICILPKYCIIININQKTKINSKSFEGVNIINYRIGMPKKYIKLSEKFSNFNNEILLESYIYTKNTYENVKRLINEENLKFKCFLGYNGKIKPYEFARIKKMNGIKYKKYYKKLDKIE